MDDVSALDGMPLGIIVDYEIYPIKNDSKGIVFITRQRITDELTDMLAFIFNRPVHLEPADAHPDIAVRLDNIFQMCRERRKQLSNIIIDGCDCLNPAND